MFCIVGNSWQRIHEETTCTELRFHVESLEFQEVKMDILTKHAGTERFRVWLVSFSNPRNTHNKLTTDEFVSQMNLSKEFVWTHEIEVFGNGTVKTDKKTKKKVKKKLEPQKKV